MAKTLILVNTLSAINNFAYSNHVEFVSKLHKQYPEEEFLFYTPHRMSIDNARNSAAKIAIEADCDYILMLDDDVIVPMDGYSKLRNADKDVVAGVTYTRAYPFPMMAFREQNNDLECVELDTRIDGPQEVFALGFSFCLIKIEVLKKLEAPWFVTIHDRCTEDIYFCHLVKGKFPETSIFVHTGVHTSHILTPEVVHPSNVKTLREMYSQGRALPETCVLKN